MYTRESMIRMLAERTGNTIEKTKRDADRQFYMNAEEAVAYGVADTVMKPAQLEEVGMPDEIKSVVRGIA
jgi:ATP-dependent Clp protease protease subunit